MHKVDRYLGPLFIALLGILCCTATGWAINDRDEILVGRIAHIEGDLMRYVEETKDWSLTVPDAPFGLEDALYSGNNAKAEMILPNETWLRIGEDTQVQMIDLNSDATTVDVASGLARLYNRSRDVVIKATTPFGYVVAPAGSAFDLYVGDESLEVIAVRGEVDFVHEASGTRYPVRQGGNSIIADRQTATQGNGSVDGSWDDWNNQRESTWAQRQRSRTSSANLLPAPIREDAYTLEDNGRWERVYYDGDYRDLWRPTRVDNGWRPFTNGRWVDYYGDNCWIPSESFGYVTHHYGSWVYVDAFRAWYWMPPAPRRAMHRPGLTISFGWYPGRVGWFHHGRDIGWVPLAPNEDYYGYRHWGHRTRVIRDHAPMIDLGRYHYLNHASIIDRDHLYRGDRYPRDIRRDVNKTVIINQYKPVTQWNDFRQDKRRFDFGDRHIDRKPHTETIQRIQENDRRRKEIDRLDRGRIERDLQQVKVSNDIPTKRDIRPPINTSKIVDADKRTAPLDRGTLPTREFKPKERERTISPEGRHGFDASSAGQRAPENSDRFNRRPPQEENQQRLRSPRDRQVEESGNRNFGENQPQERQRGPRDPQELRRSREEQRTGDGQRPTFSREQELQGRGSKESAGKTTEEQLRPQRPDEAKGEERQSGGLGADRRDRFNQPTGDEQREIQQGRDGGERQRLERPDLRNQSQDDQRPQRQFDRRPNEQQQQQTESDDQLRRQGDERLQQQREQAQQQEMQQRRQDEGLRRQQEQDRKSQAEAREQEMQRDRQQQLRQQQVQSQQQELQRRQQREADDRQQQRLQQQREQSQQQEMMQRRQQEDERRQQESLRNRQAEERQQEAQREQQQQLRRQRDQEQQEMQRRQQQEAQRERQQEMQRQKQEQQQEMQRRQQEAQREQQQELQRQRQEQQRQQQQQQELQRKKRPLTPEEQQKLNQGN